MGVTTRPKQAVLARRAPRRMSPSGLERYRSCPKAFAYQYIEKAEQEDRPSPILVIGNAVHGALDRFYGLPDEHRSLDVLHQALRSVWPEHRNADAFMDTREESESGMAALEMLSRYADSHDLHARPREREGWGRAQLPNGIQVFGKLDRIDIDDDGAVTVIDYKTGRRAISEKEMPENVAAQIYCLAVADRFRGAAVTFRLEYLALGRDLSWSPTAEQLAAARERLVALTDEVHGLDYEAGEFVATPGAACGFCPFAYMCPDKDRVRLEDLVVSEAVPF